MNPSDSLPSPHRLALLRAVLIQPRSHIKLMRGQTKALSSPYTMYTQAHAHPHPSTAALRNREEKPLESWEYFPLTGEHHTFPPHISGLLTEQRSSPDTQTSTQHLLTV